MKYQQIILNRMRFLNKRIFHPVILKFAGASHSPISIICHVGRRSGTPCSTPIIALRLGNRFVLALPYGNEVNWYRNILAAGRGTVIWGGEAYPVENPGPLIGGIDFPTPSSRSPVDRANRGHTPFQANAVLRGDWLTAPSAWRVLDFKHRAAHAPRKGTGSVLPGNIVRPHVE